jgi:phage shock protein A
MTAASNIPGYHNANSGTPANTGRVQSAGADSAAALQAQVSQEQVQLNDWVTCVSASTPKGKAEIQSISSQISAAQAQIRTIEATQAAAKAATQAPSALSGTSSAPASGSIVDAWA